jgi:hypothetical protein
MVELERDRLERGRRKYSLNNAEFKESDHPRGESGRFGEGGSQSKSFSVDPEKIKKNPIPKNLRDKWMKSGGVNNPEYKAWIKKHWEK